MKLLTTLLLIGLCLTSTMAAGTIRRMRVESMSIEDGSEDSSMNEEVTPSSHDMSLDDGDIQLLESNSSSLELESETQSSISTSDF